MKLTQKRFDRLVQFAGGILILGILAALVTQGDLASETIMPVVYIVLAAAGIEVGRRVPHNRED